MTRAEYIWILSWALTIGAIIYWLPTPSGVQPFLQRLTPTMWEQVATA